MRGIFKVQNQYEFIRANGPGRKMGYDEMERMIDRRLYNKEIKTVIYHLNGDISIDGKRSLKRIS